MKLNSFLLLDEVYTNDLVNFLETKKSDFRELFNVPSEEEHKILRKIHKLRSTLN